MQLDSPIDNAIIHKYDIFENYIFNHRRHLCENPMFKLFSFSYHNNRQLAAIIQTLNPTHPNNEITIYQLEQLRQENRRKADQAYEDLVTPALIDHINRTYGFAPYNSPPPMQIIPPPRSPSPIPTSSSRTSPRKPRQRNCYKCHKPSHQK